MREMKDSGVSSFGMVPQNWSVTKLKNILNLRSVKSGGVGDLLSVYLDKGVISYEDSDGQQVHKPSLDLSNYQIVRPGDFVLNNQQAWRGSVGVSKYQGIISPAYFVYAIDNSCFSNYMNYLLRDKVMVQQYETASRGVGTIQRNLYAPWFLNSWIVLPSKVEQRVIATFLDSKCAEIDALSADIQSEIDILEAYKRSVIIESVTKGLNNNAPMKKSGIPWIGDVPEHWLVEKVKYHLNRYEPKNPGNQQVLSVYREYGVIPKDSRDDNHNVTSEDTSKYKYVKPGNLVINKMKAWQGSMGVSNYEGIVSPAYFIYHFTDDNLIPKYLHYLFRSCYKDEFRRISGGIREGQWDLSPEAFANTLVLLPPVNEQLAIVEAIDEKIAEIESIIAQKQEQIAVLVDYKKSTIYEYVTGKKEVV